MSTHQAAPAVHFRAAPGEWLYAKQLWAGVSIIAMWLAVLFVGVYGGSIVSNNVDGASSSVPVVIIVAGLAFIATLVLGRAFKAGDGDAELRRALADERSAREELAREVAELRRERQQAS